VERYKKNVLKEKYFPQFDRVAFNLAFLNPVWSFTDHSINQSKHSKHKYYRWPGAGRS